MNIENIKNKMTKDFTLKSFKGKLKELNLTIEDFNDIIKFDTSNYDWEDIKVVCVLLLERIVQINEVCELQEVKNQSVQEVKKDDIVTYTFFENDVVSSARKQLIYKAVIEGGKTGITEIAEYTNLPKQTVYSIIYNCQELSKWYTDILATNKMITVENTLKRAVIDSGDFENPMVSTQFIKLALGNTSIKDEFTDKEVQTSSNQPSKFNVNIFNQTQENRDTNIKNVSTISDEFIS